MYMPGRLRTASSPSRTVMFWASYEPLPFEPFFFAGCSAKSFLPPRKSPDSGTPVGRVEALHKTALDTSRLPLEPDGSEAYKMPANRDKMRLLSDGSGPNL